jgi:D-alanyl-lipoteichoic acid acyltransferase DltB (MBOAT superfamily)
MIFNSIEFAVFLPVVFFLYWFVFDKWMSKSRHQLRWQNAFVLVASYVFYGWWSWKFLVLIAFTSFCSYLSGRQMATGRWRKTALRLNIIVNLAILGLFKYYDFFAAELAGLLGVAGDKFMLHLVLPVGISFYTFQALSYSIDVYRGKIEPTNDIVAFFAYITFFPQLVAGPIERATNLLPQFQKRREFDYDTAVDGARQILWGLFMKMVVADNCAGYVDNVFSYGGSGSEHLIAAVFFTFQIYGDFAGYSNIAIGTAKLFGIRLMQNFRTPYFSRDIAEFWRRWHISLTTWFRDYIYIPLGGSRVSKWKVVRNTFIIFLVSGLWHGANWTFIAWGFYHACLFLPLILLGRNRKYTDTVAANRVLPTVKELGQMTLTFMLAVIGWVVFRADSISSVTIFFSEMFNTSLFSMPFLYVGTKKAAMFIVVMLSIEWFTRTKEHGLQYGFKVPTWVKPLISFALVIILLEFSAASKSFIYFQF